MTNPLLEKVKAKVAENKSTALDDEVNHLIHYLDKKIEEFLKSKEENFHVAHEIRFNMREYADLILIKMRSHYAGFSVNLVGATYEDPTVSVSLTLEKELTKRDPSQGNPFLS